uniref:Exocyst subunit Exo70 family protein n=2 Tax=Anisakis simplex TaxID=6269 RepID=A0A0M3KJI0_ANISI
LMASISAYLSGHLVSLKEFFDALEVESSSSVQLKCNHGEQEVGVLGRVICEMLCKMVPGLIEMAHKNCASLSVSKYQDRLRPLIKKYPTT